MATEIELLRINLKIDTKIHIKIDVEINLKINVKVNLDIHLKIRFDIRPGPGAEAGARGAAWTLNFSLENGALPRKKIAKAQKTNQPAVGIGDSRPTISWQWNLRLTNR